MPFCGQWPPPPGRDEAWWQEETMRIIRDQPMANHAQLANASPKCKALMQAMLTKDPNQRLTASECLAQEWFNVADEDCPALSVGVAQCLDAYAQMPELKKAIFLLMAHQSAEHSLEELRAIFTHFDISNQGILDASDLRGVLEDTGMKPVAVDRVIH